MLLSTRSSARALFLFALMAAPAAAHGSVVLASNTSSTGASLQPITEAEAETDGREGLKSLELLIAMYLSARDGRRISLPLAY